MMRQDGEFTYYRIQFYSNSKVDWQRGWSYGHVPANDTHEVWEKTGEYGFWTLAHANKVMTNLKKAGPKTLFRIVKVEAAQKTTVIGHTIFCSICEEPIEEGDMYWGLADNVHPGCVKKENRISIDEWEGIN